MSLPPPPGNVPPRLPQPPGDPFQSPQPGQPPFVNGPAGYSGHPGGYPGVEPSPPWRQQPMMAPPPKSSSRWKWLLGALALLVVIGVTVAVTVTVLGRGNKEGDGSPSTAAPLPGNGATSDIASANDTGPVGIITEDPTCAAQSPIFTTLAAETQNGWEKRDPSIPATEWTPEARVQYEAVGHSMRKAAEQLVPLVKLTPHRIMRELYEQYIAYARAYADSIATYTSANNYLVRVANAASDSIGNICAAVGYGSASARAPLVPALLAPTGVAAIGDPDDPRKFLTQQDAICGEWQTALTQADNDLAGWLAIPSDIPAAQWTPEQKAINEKAAMAMSSLASRQQDLAEGSDNATLRDFADLAAQYRRSYVAALPSYIPTDNYLVSAANKLGSVVTAACQAVAE